MSVKYIILLLFMLAVDGKKDARAPHSSPGNPHVFATCVENLGCIDVNEKWYDVKYRPVNLEPLDRHTIRTEFLLLKHGNNESKEILYDILTLKPESVKISGLKRGENTVFVIHDFTSNGHTGWVKHITVALTDKVDSNVISVDWEAGAEPPFDQAIANSRVVALEMQVFIQMLKNSFSVQESKIHLIGHGVGAHIAGYVGKSLPGIARITGLDPTGPRFENMPPIVRLDADDATYVEVLHTDAFNARSQGTMEPMGHADFYVNNAGHQPGCEEIKDLPKFTEVRRDNIREGTVLPACSHKRSFKYYINSILGADCSFTGVSCPSYDDFIVGNCTDCEKHECATFGLVPPTICTKYNKFYIVTDSDPPYCLHIYQVNVTIDTNPKAKQLEGYFEFMFVDEDKKVTNATGYLDQATHRVFVPGQKYELEVYTSPPKINGIEEAKVKWICRKSQFLKNFGATSTYVKDISVKRISFTNEESATTVLCPEGDTEMKDNSFEQFSSCLRTTPLTAQTNDTTTKPGTKNITATITSSTSFSAAGASTSSFTKETTTTNPATGGRSKTSDSSSTSTAEYSSTITSTSDTVTITEVTSTCNPEFENLEPLVD